MRESNEHLWCRARLSARRADLLCEESERFDEHLATCQECRQLYETYRDDTEITAEGDDHIPSSMLARWDLTRWRLRGLERELVRNHLERCEECRQDLRLLGFEPVLSADLGASQPPGGSTSGRNWQIISISGWALLATAALVLMLLLPQSNENPPELGFDEGPIPWVTPLSLRGDDLADLTLSAGTRTIMLVLRMPENIRSIAPVSVEIISPDGGSMALVPIAPEDLRRSVTMIPLSSETALAEGCYRVLFRQGGSGSPDEIVAEQSFEILHLKG